jgi:hypothetical protein
VLYGTTEVVPFQSKSKLTPYVLSRVVVTRSDSGKEVFNISEVLAAASGPRCLVPEFDGLD